MLCLNDTSVPPSGGQTQLDWIITKHYTLHGISVTIQVQCVQAVYVGQSTGPAHMSVTGFDLLRVRVLAFFVLWSCGPTHTPATAICK